MRKLFLAMAAVAALFASCSKDDTLTGVSKSKVSFTVSAPELATRAGEDVYGEGSEATTLYYAVYDAVEGTSYVGGLSNVAGEDFTGGTKEITLALVEGRTYDIIFYAQNAAESPYFVNWEAKTLNINGEYLDSDKQNKVLTANKEAYDAFYAHVDQLKVGNQAINKTVYLKRPFAQLNILTNDTDLAAKAGIDIDQSEVTVKNIYTSMNLYTDKVVPESETAVTYAMAAIPGDVVEVNSVKYNWLSMNYLLVNEKKMVDVEFKMHDKSVATGQEADAILSRTYTTVAVERNHRTNIYGSIITNPAKFNVEIQAGFLTPDHNVNGSEQYETTVSTAKELQDAIDAAKAGTRTIIKLGQDIVDATAAEIWVAQADDVQIVIDGCGYEFNGSFKVHNNSAVSCNGTLDIVNFNFTTNVENHIFVHTKTFENTKRYSQNITVANCTFEATNNVANVVGVHVHTSKNLHIMNCTAKNIHSLLQAQSCDDVILVENVNLENVSEGGVSFGNAASATIKNSTIVGGNGAIYGIRADHTDARNTNFVIENVTISGTPAPIAVRNVTSNKNNTAISIALEGNTLTSTGLYDVIFTAANINTAASLNTLTNPTGNWSITGAEDLTVYPRDLAVSTAENLQTALKSLKAGYSPVIKFVKDITVSDDWDCRNTGAKTTVPVEIDGNGHTLKLTGKIDDKNYFSVFRFESAAEVSNLTIDLSSATSGNNNIIKAISTKGGVILDNCKFIGNTSYPKGYGVIFGETAGAEISDVEISITGCEFENWTRRGISDNENGKDVKSVTIEDNTFTNANVYVSAYEKITFVGNTMNNSLVNITSYTSAATAKVKATDNTLDTTQNNVIGSSSKMFSSANVEAQAGITVNAE